MTFWNVIFCKRIFSQS